MYDVIIIGAGVSGSAIARELSRYELKLLVLERALDVCEGTSKANSGIVHAGYDAKSGTLKAKLNVAGSKKMEKLSGELDFPYKKNGSLVLCFEEKDLDQLEALKKRGEINGVSGIRILDRQEVLELEPAVAENVVAALYAPDGAIVCPFGLNIALAENAAVNGAEFLFGREVIKIEKIEKGYRIRTKEEVFDAGIVINAAGVYADTIHNMISEDRMEITPRRGEYLLYDKSVGGLTKHTLFQLPTALGKGILVTPTVHGNLLTGPTAQDLNDKESVETSGQGMELVQQKAAWSVPDIPQGAVITSFAGLRAHVTKVPEAMQERSDDFLIGEVKDAPGFIDVAGIESPGLSCAPAVGEYVADIVKDLLHPVKKENFIAERKGIFSMALADAAQRQEAIAADPAYANVICRCEMVTEGEIMDAIHRPLGATTTDGIKRRTRAGMGRCQSGFCNPKVVELLARELGVDESKICKSGAGSFYLLPEETEA